MTRLAKIGKVVGSVLLWLASILMALGMLLVGLPKVMGAAPWVEYFDAWGYAPWFRVLTGLLQVGAGLSLLIPRFAVYGAALLIIIMMGAEITELTHDVGFGPVVPLVYLGVLSGVLLTRGRRWWHQRERAER